MGYLIQSSQWPPEEGSLTLLEGETEPGLRGILDFKARIFENYPILDAGLPLSHQPV